MTETKRRLKKEKEDRKMIKNGSELSILFLFFPTSRMIKRLAKT